MTACESSAALELAADVGAAPRQLARGCFIRSDGRAGCRDRHGAPAQHVDVADAVEIRGDAGRGCVRTGAGAVWCWQPDELWRPTPARPIAVDSLGEIVQLVSAAGPRGRAALHCARQRSGGVSCWGAAAWHIDVDRPADEPRALPGAANVRDLAIDGRLCVVLEGGAVRCSADEYAAPLRPIVGIKSAVAVEVFGADLCVRVRGGVRCAGPSYGEPNSSVAVRDVGDVARLVAIEGAHCGVDPEGRHRCWRPGPTPRAHRMPELAGVRAVAGRCAVHDDGRVSCWVRERPCGALPLCGQEPRLGDSR